LLDKIKNSLKRLDQKSRAIAVALFMLPAGFILSLVFLLFERITGDKKEFKELKKENKIL